MDKKLARIIFDLYNIDVDVPISRTDPAFGDFATNIAMQLAGRLGKNPREIATAITEALDTDDQIARVEVAGPGFINITVSDEYLLDLVRAEPEQQSTGRVVVIETNNPNPFKAMHIGHAYNAILADTIANIIEDDGANTHRVSYHGDVGLHVGKSMWAILRDTGGDTAKLQGIAEGERNSYMSRMYAEGSREYKESPEVKTEIDELAKQSFVLDDPTYKAIYDMISSWSYKQIDAIVARLGSRPTERRYVESQTEEPGKKLIKDNTPGVFTLSDGAYIFEGSKYGSFDNVLIGSSGNGLYGAHDMGLIELKYRDYPDMARSIVVTGGEQAAYFKGIIAAGELCHPELAGKLANISTGLVKLTTGKMSSRTGDVIEIDWLFDQFAEAIRERGGVPDDEIIAGALRYQFLKVKIGSDVVFDINEAVSLTGNTGSYLQYAHARAKRILDKATGEYSLEAVRDEDKALVRKLGEYSEVVGVVHSQLEPHHLCNYLYELAQEFNRYYEKNRVVGGEHEAHRLALVKVYADTLNRGLGVLGIIAPDKM